MIKKFEHFTTETEVKEINTDTFSDILFDMGVNIISVDIDSVKIIHIVVKHNHTNVSIFYSTMKKTLELTFDDLIIKSNHRIKDYNDLVITLGDLLKRV